MCMTCSTVDLKMSLLIVVYAFFSASCVLILKQCGDLLLIVGIFHFRASVIFSGNQHTLW